MGHASGMKPVILMLVAQVALAGVNIFFKLAITSGASLPVLIAYRFLFSTAIMVPLALIFFNRQVLLHTLHDRFILFGGHGKISESLL
ncbi:WAT1-related protein [Cardamine amara subsp. amara]|uniref:WAT1-related protein n=1 Tax=Cardamine amara subsp. amara TaxID=228776 RepID=A0ABD0Z142_CARAN